MKKTIVKSSILIALVNLCCHGAVNVNQIGYYPQSQKHATIVGASGQQFYVIRSNTTDTVFKGALGASKNWQAANENTQAADFSGLSDTGTFVLCADGAGVSSPFSITKSVLRNVAIGSIKSYYFQRASTSLTAQYAQGYARPLGHPDSSVRIHPSAATAKRPGGTIISSPRGWYDAGDYGKYIVNSGISMYTLLALYQLFPSYFDSVKILIPESGNGIPDLLNEALWNLRWMLTMQDPDDGGVYHKLTTADFSGFVMPAADTATRWAVKKSTAAALDFAAVCAQANRIFKKYPTLMPGFADSCLQASLAAWNWARKNPNVLYNQTSMNATYSPAITTGEYGDNSVSDELYWAATELFLSTQQDSFFTVANPTGKVGGAFPTPSWSSVKALGLYSLFLSAPLGGSKADAPTVTGLIKAMADTIVKAQAANPYGVAMANSDFIWGSNSVAANKGITLILAAVATRDSVYKNAAINHVDYLLGKNPLHQSFVTGFGAKPPMHPHHRPSEADGIIDPIPGFLVGGPNSGQQDAKDCSPLTYPVSSSFPALSYFDNVCSYASNEVAINWSAPFAFLAGSLDAMEVGRTPITVVNSGRMAPMADRDVRVMRKNGLVLIRLINAQKISVKLFNLQGKAVSSVFTKAGNFLQLPDRWACQTLLLEAWGGTSNARAGFYVVKVPVGQ